MFFIFLFSYFILVVNLGLLGLEVWRFEVLFILKRKFLGKVLQDVFWVGGVRTKRKGKKK